MFDEHFPAYCAETVMRWTPTWSKQTDPSGRYVGVSTLLISEWSKYILITNRAIAIHNQKYEEAK